MKKLICIALSISMALLPIRSNANPALGATVATAVTAGGGVAIAAAALVVGASIVAYGYARPGANQISDYAVSIVDSFIGSRSNPNRSLWDDPSPGARDVSPKASVSPETGSVGPEVKQGPDGLVGLDAWFSWIMSGTALADGSYVRSYSTTTGTSSQGWFPNIQPVGGIYPRTMEYGGATWQSFDDYRPRYATSQNFNAQAYKCPTGYTLNGSLCSLTDATQTKKAGVPCELLRTANGFEVDSRNPACAGISASGPSVSMGRDTFTQGADGSLTWNFTDGSGRSRTIVLSPPAANGGGRVVTSVDGSTEPGSSGVGASPGASPIPGSTTGTSTGTGSGSGTGTTPTVNISGSVVWNKTTEDGSFQSQQTKVDRLKQEISSKMDSIKAEAQQLFTANISGNAKAPTYSFTVLGRVYEIDLNKHASAFATIGSGIVFCSVIIALFLILG